MREMRDELEPAPADGNCMRFYAFYHVREFARNEIKKDAAEMRIYVSQRLTLEGQRAFVDWLLRAFAHGVTNPESELLLRVRDHMRDEEPRLIAGQILMVQVPMNAAEVLARGEANRYHCRALCLHAMAHPHVFCGVRVYRAKSVAEPRPESEALIGKILDPEDTLHRLRHSFGVDQTLGLGKPGSGLSLHLARKGVNYVRRT